MSKEKTLNTNKRVFQMIKILRSNNKIMKAREIAEQLGLKNTRSISKYKEIILLLGIPIKTMGGNKGGYYIDLPKKLDLNEIYLVETSNLSENLKQKIKLLNDEV